jgi:hypothetical protein
MKAPESLTENQMRQLNNQVPEAAPQPASSSSGMASPFHHCLKDGGHYGLCFY